MKPLTISPSLLTLLFFLSLNAFSSENPYMDRLNQGWPDSYQSLEKHLHPQKSYLVFLSKTPLASMDFRSADQLRRSILATPDSSREDIGHNLFGWSCPRTRRGPQKGFASQSGEHQSQGHAMLKSGWGLTMMFSSFLDGNLFNPSENNSRTILPYLDKDPFRLFTMILEVSDQECESTAEFMHKYTSRNPATGLYPFQRFGFLEDPHQLEGGGCGSVAVAAVQHGNFFGEVEKHFHRVVALPIRFMGRPLQLNIPHVDPLVFDEVPPGREVSLMKLVSFEWKESEPTKDLPVIDPEMILLFMRTLTQELLNEKVSAREISLTQARRYDSQLARKMIYQPKDPQDSESTNYDMIDSTYDENAYHVVEASRDWYRNKRQQGYKFLYRSWEKQKALIIQK